MIWVRGGALVGGLLAAAALGGCGHEQATVESTTPVAQAQQPAAVISQQPLATVEQPALMPSERQPIAGRDISGAVLTPEGRYQTPKGRYQQPQGEYFSPQGIYGEKGRVISQGKVLEQGTYGRFYRPEGTVHQPEGVTAQPEGTFYKPFGSSEMSERQPVAGREATRGAFFVRDASGKIWQVKDPAVIQRVEQKLSDLGCDPGRIDGKADQQFSTAFMQCQDKLGVQPNGILDEHTASAFGLDWNIFREPTRRFVPGEKTGAAVGGRVGKYEE